MNFRQSCKYVGKHKNRAFFIGSFGWNEIVLRCGNGLRDIAPRDHRQMEGGTQGPRSAHRRFNGPDVQIRSPLDRRRDAISVFRL